MPRGGRRIGAGAPRGNFNGFRSGNYSPRMYRTYARLCSALDDREDLFRTGYALRDAGFFVAGKRHYEFNGDTRGALEFLHHFWFDSATPAQSNEINETPPPPLNAVSTQPSQVRPAPPTGANGRQFARSKKYKIQSNAARRRP